MTLKFSQLKPAQSVNSDLYITPASKQSVISTISMCNVSSSTDYARVFITPSGNAYDQNALYYDLEIVPSDTFLSTAGFTVPYGSKMVCYSENGGISFGAFYDEGAVS